MILFSAVALAAPLQTLTAADAPEAVDRAAAAVAGRPGEPAWVRTFVTPDGRWVVADDHARAAWVWSGARLVALGEASPLAVGEGRYLLETPAGLADVATGARVLLPDEAGRPPVSYALDGDTLRVAAFRTDPSRIELLEVTDAGVAVAGALEVGRWRAGSALGAIDRRRLLLWRGDVGLDGPWTPFDVDIAVADFDAGRIEAIGAGKGTWTADTAVPHPTLDVVWAGAPVPVGATCVDRVHAGGRVEIDGCRPIP